ncbi:DUF603 domain-containing protein [Cloacibacillus evryensis]|uniref:DUF603 domain-containing protein n=1 Tax=Cloacibacillus evryensis TaxID=508460 RepID=UPI00210D2253|nr:DUF603 domain-containing protein [Cloacibacillus evryensis]MCQ4763304.1 DUF603 domain-containing protein [Cloacibacillus evryensis]
MDKTIKSMFAGLLLAVLTLMLAAASANAAEYDNIIKRWQKTNTYNDMDGTLKITVTYYSAEYVEAHMQSEAQKNLWTQDEIDKYKYNYLQLLQLNEMIPVNVEFENNGPSIYPGPFDKMIEMKVGNKTYKPSDYDKRLNFKFQGKKEGLVYFKRYDDKTGKDILSGQNRVTISLNSGLSSLMNGRTPRFFWDINNDDPGKLYAGQTAVRFETDRLIKRLEKLRKDKAEEEAKLASINGEISTIQARLDELAKQ